MPVESADPELTAQAAEAAPYTGFLKTNFFAPLRGGHVHGVSHTLHKGKHTIVVDTELRDDKGKLLARVTQTQAVL